MNGPVPSRDALPALLVVEDDEATARQLRLALGRDFRVLTAGDAHTAWALLREERPELITLDLALDDGGPESGFSLLERFLSIDPYLKIVLITGNDDEVHALRAIQRGAADFFGKPVDPQELRVLLRRLVTLGRLERENAALLQSLGEECRLGSILGRSAGMRALFRDIEKVAPVDISVLVLGESGTGKELVAKEIRRLSPRATKPFVSINCAAIPDTLLESELFGHERGAFTSAHVARVGRLEMAEGGIVFLDEVGELPLPLQGKLLRFLQDHEIERVGGREVIRLDVRILAATSRNLEEEVRRGRFREDLYYRLCVVNLKVPPLRERREDILFLADYFLSRFAAEFGRGRLTFASRARSAMQQHRWPGNVRELEHRVQKAVLLADAKTLDTADLGLESAGPDTGLSLREARDVAEHRTIITALRLTGGNISRAARLLQISRPSLHEILARRQINARDFRSRAPAAPVDDARRTGPGR